MKYIRDLHNVDDRVISVSPQIRKANRVFVGMVVFSKDVYYCIPLSHPKKKHETMRDNAEIQKIYDGNKIIGVLNYNLMIPVMKNQISPVDLKIHRNDSYEIKAWKNLCIKELKWCRKNEKIIRDKAKNILFLFSNEEGFKGRKRCLDFDKLEQECRKYNGLL